MLYQVDGLSAAQKVYSVRAWLHANGSSSLASSGLSSLGSSGSGHYTLNYSYTYPDTYASVAVIPNNNYDDCPWFDSHATTSVRIRFWNGGNQSPSRWSAMVVR